MRQPSMRPLIDVSACAEARAWEHRPGTLGLEICGCGTAGVLVAEDGRSSGGDPMAIRKTYRHNFYIDPIITFEPDATAIVGGTMLGPGLHRAIGRRRFVECECRFGQVVRQFEETSTIE